MDIQTELNNVLEHLQNNIISEEELTKMIEETRETKKLVYYLLVITKYFPIQDFNIILENNENEKLILTIGAKYDIENEELDFEDFHCLYLMIEPAKIYIENLNKCGNYTGTDMMFRVIHYAKEVKIPKLELTDKSKLYLCKSAVNLAYLNILSSGKSWYNSKDFYSDEFNAEQTNNLLVINKPFNELVEVIIENLTNPLIEPFITDIKELNRNFKNNPKENIDIKIKTEFRKLINDAIPANNNITIQEVFQNIQRQFRSFPNSKCSKEQEQLIRIINIIITMLNHNSSYEWAKDFVIKYDYSKLEYTVPLSGGKKNKTKKNKKRN